MANEVGAAARSAGFGLNEYDTACCRTTGATVTGLSDNG
jgi:hypothetical protein